MLDPTPVLPDDTPISRVQFPTRIQNVLSAAGLRTVGEVREATDEMLLGLPDLGKGSVDHLRKTLESVRRDHAGLHSFLSMSLIEARRRNASAFRLRFSQSLARRLHRPSHANVRSTTQRFGRTTNPFA
jgi:Bacterial RNA polymerase, alpha chain C terminal domain